MEFEKFIFDESAFYPFPTLFLNFSFNGKVQCTNSVIELVILKNILSLKDNTLLLEESEEKEKKYQVPA